ncbi:MAG TPA: hypothetical protein VFP90_01775 [Gemmatimonadaceae bacterium]|nr:hypothetical protein [Gemmatimonadaceae bacterium]
MTFASWLDARRPAPPAALRARIDAALGGALHDEGDVPAVCLAAGERLVREIIRENATSRASALDLLAADALVTYAFEAASEDPAELERRAADAMARISAIAGEPRGDGNASDDTR